jgi:hypothetical protein
MVLNFLKVAAYVKILALSITLAEKHVSKILKCFTISAAPCIIDIPHSCSAFQVTRKDLGSSLKMAHGC